ncbi:MAG: RimK family alpha-L-glutamate ligase [Blastocatellia bacterium]
MKIGILVGREGTFPQALISEINGRNAGVTAEYVKLGGVRMAAPLEYDTIVDRISHEIPFYRAFLKSAVLAGTKVLNNPFWWTADDKFFNYSLATYLGIAIPKTVLLPQKEYKEGVVSESLRNLEYPLDWQGIIDYVGLPAFIKPYDGGGWRGVSRVNTFEELMEKYDASGTDCMVLQEFIPFDHYVRSYCIGKRDVYPMTYDPTFQRYLVVDHYLDKATEERVRRETILINQALGYDINTVEFAIKDGIPYAIDYMNPAPDADWWSVGSVYFKWLVEKVADLAVDTALHGEPTLKQHRWIDLLNDEIKRPGVGQIAGA